MIANTNIFGTLTYLTLYTPTPLIELVALIRFCTPVHLPSQHGVLVVQVSCLNGTVSASLIGGNGM